MGADLVSLVSAFPTSELANLAFAAWKSFKARDNTPAPHDDGSRVASVARLTSLADKALIAAVAADRADGASWADVGSTLGITRSAAHGRFSPAVERLEQQLADGADSTPTALKLSAIVERAWADIEGLAKQEQERALARVIAANPQMLSAVLEKQRSDELAQLHQKVDLLTSLIQERLGDQGKAAQHPGDPDSPD